MYGRQNNYFPQQNNVRPFEESATGSRIGGEHRVIRSEVWSRFRLEGLNAVCLVCNEKLKVGPTRQTSSLWRHLKRHNRTPAAATQNQRIPSGFQFAHHQSRLYLQQQSQLRRNNNNLTLNGIAFQQQQNVPRGGLTLHNFRLQPQTLRTAPAAFLPNSNFHQHSNHQQSYRHLLPCSSSSASFTNNHSPSLPSPSSAVQIPLIQPPPSVTVDCKPVENRELDQLLGIRRDEEEEEEEEHEGNGREEEEREEFIDRRGEEEESINGMMEEEEEEGIDEMMEEEEEDGHDEQLTMGREWQLARTLTEFTLENALSFHRLFIHSSSFTSLLRLTKSVPKSLPSPAFLLQNMLPKLFADTLEERKMRFNDDFFVLILHKNVLMSGPKQTALLSVAAQKLSDSFSLCSRSLGQFAFDCSNSAGMANALRHCLEEGPVRLRLWQISAIVHDGDADSEELCRQMDVPGIPSIHSLIRRTYVELDRLEFPPEFVLYLKKRFEKAVDEVLNGTVPNSLTDAFSVLIPALISRIDRFFCDEQNATTAVDDKREEPEMNEGEKKCGSAPVPIHRLEQLLLAKFQLLWKFQRRKLVEMETAKMALFLNPSNLSGTKRAKEEDGQEEEFFGESIWHETAERVREQISQACEEGTEENAEEAEGAETKMKLLREDIQSEVTNYMETARLELGHHSSASNKIGSSPSSSPPPSAHFASLAELLFWWRINAERFPRLVQLARQFCAVPMDNGDQWRSKATEGSVEEEETNATRRYAAELIAKDGDIGRVESGRMEQLQLLTQMMTVRMAARERAVAHANGEETNDNSTH